MLPKIIKAAVKGTVWLIFLYVVPTFIFSYVTSALPAGTPNILADYQQIFGVFAGIFVFFVVASELTSGTIFQHMLNIGRALIFMVFVVLALEGGVIALDFQNIHIVADLTIYLVMLLTIDLVVLVKNVLQAINFLSEKTESQLPPLSPKED